MNVIVEDSVIVTISVDKEVFPMAIEAPDDIMCGDTYTNGKFQRVAIRPDPIVLTPQELREQAYESMTYKGDGFALITWENQNLTVDKARKIFLEYLSEGNEKTNNIQPLIATAKEYIRNLYPDIN